MFDCEQEKPDEVEKRMFVGRAAAADRRVVIRVSLQRVRRLDVLAKADVLKRKQKCGVQTR